MGRTPCCEKSLGLKKGPWTPDEDEKLIEYIKRHGHGSWRALPKRAGLLRCGKSCRLRWTNYLRPDIKRGKFSIEEEHAIIELHAVLGNKWSTIAGHLPGRTDNEIKNYWNTHLKKRLLHMGIDPVTHRPRADLLGLPSSCSSPFNVATLSHVQKWENTRLAGTAEYLRQALYLSDKGFTPITDLCMRPNEQYSLPWVQQQPGMSLDFKGLPQNLEQLLHSQTTESATSNIKNLEQLLMQCQNIGYCAPLNNSIINPSEYSNGSNVAAFASPCSTLTSMEGLQKKIHMLFHNQEDILTKQAAVDLSEGEMNINIMKAADHKPKVSFDQENLSYNNNNGNQSCSEPTTTLWSACLDPLQLVGSSTTAYNEAEEVPFITSSSTRENKPHEGEVGANEAGAKEYWSKVLKALGPIPASHTITAQQ